MKSSNLCSALLLLLAVALAPTATFAVANPTVSTPPAGTKGHPLWDSWFDLAPLGYQEEEYFISGTAHHLDGTSPAAYTTRIIVTRPIAPGDFNGTVMMDWVNVTAQFENAVDTITSHDYLLREGYAFVHVSAQSAGICCTPLTPKIWDPVRYAALDHPGDTYSYDMVAQIAQALRSPAQGAIDMMGGLTVDRIIAAGQSQSAGFLQTYVESAQGGIGGNVIDGFLIHGRVGGNHVAISTAADAKATPVLQLSSDFEASPPDPIATPYYALWEIAGAAHADFWIGVHQEEGGGPRSQASAPKLPPSADEDLHLGNPPYPSAAENYGEQIDPGQQVCIAQGAQFPMHYAANAALDALDRWLRDGVQPASGPRYTFNGSSLARDAFSNALGGIRLAPIEHPVARYRSTDCQLGGITIPFTDGEIHALYPTHAEYACKMKNTTYQNLADRWILPEDAVDLLARVDAATNRWATATPPGGIGVQDCDADGVPDDVDNCPYVYNPGQEDDGGVDTHTPDGIGNACQCGDVTGNGVVDGQDGNAIRRRGLGIEPNPLYRVPGNCDASGSGTCNGIDGNLAKIVSLAGQSHPLFGQNCENAEPLNPCFDCGEPDPEASEFFIEPGPNAWQEVNEAFFLAVAGDTIEFAEGHFPFPETLETAHKENITLKGQGQDKTILDFLDSNSPEGISFSHMVGLTIEELTVIDTPGFAIKVSDSNFVTIRNVRTMWSSADSDPNDAIDDRGGMDPTIPSTLEVACVHEASFPESTGVYVDKNGQTRNYQVDSGNGGYAIYPVLSNDVLIDNVIAIGSSDAGIYVGQSNDIVIKNSEALFNVAGFEIENSDNADVFGNVAHCNTGGFLTFDLPGLNQYGEKTRTFNNYSGYNNTPNFAPGGIVSAVPQGIGMLQLGYDEHEIFNNTIEWNRSVGFVYVSHKVLGGDSGDNRQDDDPDAVHVHDNTFVTNGTQPQPPQQGAIVCAPGTGPGFDDPIPCVPTDFDDSHPSLLPALIQIKGSISGDIYGPTGAHIVWDGLYDETNNVGCFLEYPGIEDENGKPDYNGSHTPSCRYIGYKFDDPNDPFDDPDDPANRRHPQYWSCIADEGDAGGNTFSVDSRKFMNFDGTDPTVPPQLDIDAHDCPGQFGTQLAALPQAVVEEYTPGANGPPPPSASEIAAICQTDNGSAVNRAALPYNCEKLSHYNLFTDATDPRSGAREGGILFDLTTPLFSDYAQKSRFLFLPPGESAGWLEGNAGTPNATLVLPVGTVIAKTFWFDDQGGAGEDVVETRLLIHRQSFDGSTFWEGMAYIWDPDGQDATLAVGGGTKAVTWNYPDPDPDVPPAPNYAGSTTYSIPNANQCGRCHGNTDQIAGDAPIGLKVRLLNRPMDYGSGPKNQLQHWVDSGLLSGAPALSIDANEIATNAQRAPRFNVPGDASNIPAHPSDAARFAALSGPEQGEELRVRAWLESNCAHCHNQKGLAKSSGVWLDTFRVVDQTYGICKTPTTAGASSGGRPFDIVPQSADDSIVSFRLHATDTGIRMPPIARSVVHDEAVALFDHWVDTIVDASYEDGSELRTLIQNARRGAAAPTLAALVALAAAAAAHADAMLDATDDFEGSHTWEGHVESTPCQPCTAPPFLCLCPPASQEPGVVTELGGPDGLLDTFLRVKDLASHHVETWNVAMDRTGDYSSAGIGRVEADMRGFGPGNLELRVGIERSGTRWVTSDAAAVALNGSTAWGAETFWLDTVDMVNVAGAGSLAFVLDDVEKIRIFHATSEQWAAQSGGAFGVDNIVLPEPGLAPGLALGALLLAGLRRRRA